MALLAACSDAPQSEIGTVIERSYQGPTAAMGTGFSGKGEVVFVPTYEGEHWFVVVSVGDWLGPIEVDKAMWARCTNGAVVSLAWREKIVDVR